VEDSVFRRCDRGVDLRGSAAIQATIDHSRIEDGVEGVDAGPNAKIVIRDSVSSGNSDAGFFTESGGQIDLENSLTTHNHYGLLSNGSMRVSQTTIEENTVGLAMFAGTTTSFGNN